VLAPAPPPDWVAAAVAAPEDDSLPANANFETMYLWHSLTEGDADLDAAEVLSMAHSSGLAAMERKHSSGDGDDEAEDDLLPVDEDGTEGEEGEQLVGDTDESAMVEEDDDEDEDMDEDDENDVEDDEDEVDADGDEEEDYGRAKTDAELAELPVQVKPLHKHSFTNLRTATCSYLCESLKQDKWRQVYKSPSLMLLRWYSYDRYKHLKRSVVSHIGPGSTCIGGGKGTQLKCRQEFARRSGCEYNSLAVQPLQFNLQNTTDCRAFFRAVEQDPQRVWIRKPGNSQNGRGVSVLRGTSSSLKSLRSCKKKIKDGLFMQAYVEQPLLLEGRKFDVRTYLLVASIDPVLVFYHDGFARLAERPFALDSAESLADAKIHVTNAVRQTSDRPFLGFDKLARRLTVEHGLPADFLDVKFRPRAREVSKMLVHAAGTERRRGRFQVFAMDWLIDRRGGVHLLEVNGDTSMASFQGTGLTPRIWTTMLDLVEKLHTAPAKLRIPRRQQRGRLFRHGRWELVYNEVADDGDAPAAYNPCTALAPEPGPDV